MIDNPSSPTMFSQSRAISCHPFPSEQRLDFIIFDRAGRHADIAAAIGQILKRRPRSKRYDFDRLRRVLAWQYSFDSEVIFIFRFAGYIGCPLFPQKASTQAGASSAPMVFDPWRRKRHVGVVAGTLVTDFGVTIETKALGPNHPIR